MLFVSLPLPPSYLEVSHFEEKCIKPIREGRKGGGRRETERKQQGERGTEGERINSSSALVPHYPGRALSPWQCGRKRIAQAWWASQAAHLQMEIGIHTWTVPHQVWTSSYFSYLVRNRSKLLEIRRPIMWHYVLRNWGTNNYNNNIVYIRIVDKTNVVRFMTKIIKGLVCRWFH